MATWYVRTGGSDGAAGTSAGAAFATIGKAVGAGGAASAGDTVYVGGGVYRASGASVSALTCGVSGSNGSPILVVADVDGSHTGDPGDARISAHYAGDGAAPTPHAAIDLNGKSYLTFDGFALDGGTGSGGSVVDGWSVSNDLGITFVRCSLFPASFDTVVRVYAAVGQTLAWTFDRCIFFALDCYGLQINLDNSGSGSGDYDANILVQNCTFLGGNDAIFVNGAGSSNTARRGGGVRVRACTFVSPGGAAVRTEASYVSPTFPAVDLRYCTVWSASDSTAVNAGTSGQIVEDYNLLDAHTARANVTAGTHSIADTTHSRVMSLGHGPAIGRLAVPPFVPASTAPWLGQVPSGASPAPPTVDMFSRPRPAGGASLNYAMGAYELHDTAAQDTGSNADGGSGSAVKLTGPADVQLLIPVSAAATTVTVRTTFDSVYSTGAGSGGYGNAGGKPLAAILANNAVGLASDTTAQSSGSASGSPGVAGTYQTLTLGPFTPTSAGWVTLALYATPAAAGGVAWFDSVSVS